MCNNVLSDNCYGHGTVVNETCECEEGYEGNYCQHCTTRFIVDEPHGSVSDGPNTVHFSKCLAVIKPPVMANHSLHLIFTYIESQCRFDFLNAYDGDSVHSPLLATFNGDVLPTHKPHVVSTSGAVTLQFHKDDPDSPLYSQGYNITYWVIKNVETSYDFESSGDDEDNTSGGCSAPWCLFQFPDMLTQGRASAAVVQHGDFLYVYGGVMFGLPEVHMPFKRFNMESKQWDKDFATNGSNPKLRHDHTMVYYNGTLIVYGGSFPNEEITNEIWKFDLDKAEWMQLNITVQSGPEVPSLIGHTAHVARSHDGGNMVMMVFFGNSPDWGITNYVFQLDLETLEWSTVKTKGAVPSGTFKHASEYDESNNVVYIHGGYNRDGSLSRQLYAFDVAERMWINLPKSKQRRYFHTMVMLKGSLYVYGGLDTITDSHECEDLADVPLMRYSVDCMKWEQLPITFNHSLTIPTERFGHCALRVEGNTMLLYGGYDGVMHSDIITFSEADACLDKDEATCNSSMTSCNWKHGKCTELCDKVDPCIALCADQWDCVNCISSACPCSFEEGMCSLQNSTDAFASAQNSEECQHPDYCTNILNCRLCYTAGCMWNAEDRMCIDANKTSAMYNESSCSDFTCQQFTSCTNCTLAQQCAWCATTQSCIDDGSSAVHFPYGSCVELVTSTTQCEDDPCVWRTSCDQCFDDTRCGWCDQGSVTGQGLCMSGSLHSSLNITAECPNDQWHFINCVDCQCNGHSTCLPSEPDVCSECKEGFDGEYCQDCDPLWYGNAENGGNCSECGCHGHALKCTNTGTCLCYQKGVEGKNCDRCATEMNYFGDPINNTCFYTLSVMTEYTFLIGLQYDYPTTQINYDICPPHKSDVIIRITLSNNTAQYATILMTTNKTSAGNETLTEAFYNASGYVAHKFYNSDFDFGSGDKTCIRVYVKDLVPTLNLTISVIQYWLNIWVIVVSFLLCFICLLLFAAVAWKVNQAYLRYHRRQHHVAEMERMAARPISSVLFELNLAEDNDLQKAPKKQEMWGCGSVTEEICTDEEAAIYTTVLQLPQDENCKTNNGSSIALGSCLGIKLRFATSLMDHNGPSLKQGKRINFMRRKVRRQNQSFDNPVLQLEIEM